VKKITKDTKNKCALFILAVSSILLIMGIVCCTYGYFSLGGGQAEVLANEYQDINVSSISSLFAMLAGIICITTGVMGILTAYYRFSIYYWMFSLPYIVMAMACGIFMLFISVLASGTGNYVERVSQDACATKLESGLTIAERIK
jgi:hypothetical protein